MKTVWSCILIGCAWVAVTAAEPAFLTIPVMKDKFILDGKLTENDWKNASGAIMIPAKYPKEREVEEGYFRIMHDDKMFYIGGEFDQTYLDPMANQLEKIRNRGVTDNDRKIYDDDCGEIFIRLHNTVGYTHLAFNSDGKLIHSFDRGLGDSTVQKKGIEVATAKTEKKWSFEVAIPWSALDLTGVPENAFQLKFYRNNAPKKQLSGWTPLIRNFHDEEHWGLVQPNKNFSGVRGIRFSAGKGGATYDLSLSQGSYDFSGALENHPLTVKLGTRTRSLQCKIDPKTGLSSLAVQCEGKTVWRSPPLNEAVLLDSAELVLDSGSYKIYLNGMLIHSGDGKTSRKLHLPGTINVIGIEFHGKAFKGTLQLGAVPVSSTDWLLADQVPDHWLTSEYIPGKEWTRYQGESLNGKKFFRFTVICDHLKFAPQSVDRILYAANKYTHELRMRTTSPVPYPLPDYEVVFECPEELSVPLYDFEDRRWNRDKHTFYNTVSDGRRTLRFSYHSPMEPRAYNFGFHVVNFIAKYDFEKEGDHLVTIYQKGRGLQEFPQQYTLKILPPLDPGHCRKIRLWIDSTGFEGSSVSFKEFQYILTSLATGGSNSCNSFTPPREAFSPETKKFLNEQGISVRWSFFIHHDRFLQKILEKHPETKYVNTVYPRAPWQISMCPLAYMESADVRNFLQKTASDLDELMFDMEFGLHSTCMCDRCRADIAREIGLDFIPDAQTLYKKYEKNVLAYQIKMLRKSVTWHKQIIHEANPRIRYLLYSGYAYPANVRAYGVDWSLYRDIELPAAGYDLGTETIAATRRALGGNPIICGFFSGTNLFEKPWGEQNFRGRLFQLLCDGGFLGAFVFAWMEIDGRGLTAFADVSRACAAFEDMLEEKYEIPASGIVADLDKEKVRVYKKNGKYLILTINLGPTPRTFSVTVPADLRNAEALNFYKKEVNPVSNSFQAEISPFDATLIMTRAK